MKVLFLLAVAVLAAFVTATEFVKIEILQTNAVIDTNPIINVSEMQLFKKGNKLHMTEKYVEFGESSPDFPAVNCFDNVTETQTTTPMPGGSSSHNNLCMSGNNNPSEQWMAIYAELGSFDRLRIFNAHGFSNPTGKDVGERILGATLSIYRLDDSVNTPVPLFTYTFSSLQPVYTIDIPLSALSSHV